MNALTGPQHKGDHAATTEALALAQALAEIEKLLAEIEELKERCRWLDQQVTTLREQRDRALGVFS